MSGRRLRSHKADDMEEILGRLEKRLDKLDVVIDKLDTLDTKITNMDTRLVSTTVKVEKVTTRVDNLESRTDAYDVWTQQVINAIRNNEISRINNELNSRQYNAVLDNVPQDDIHESRRVSIKKVYQVLSDVLKIPNAEDIMIKDAHRLPSVRGTAPLIFKVASMADKDVIWDYIANVKKFNDLQPNASSKVYVNMTHYPPKLQRDKASLLPQYKHYRDLNMKPKWRYDRQKGELCLKVNGNVIHPPTDNFDFKMKEDTDAVESLVTTSQTS